jgi:hypothetical protein
MKQKGVLKRRLAIAAGVLLIGLVGAVAARAVPILRSAPVNRFDGADAVIQRCTTASNFVNMPGMSRTFTVGGSVNNAVMAMFQGSLDLSGGQFDTGFIRLTIDGVQQTPGEVPAIAPGERGTHGFNWQSKPLAPGSHTARVQWRTDLGGTLCVDARSLMVLHR